MSRRINAVRLGVLCVLALSVACRAQLDSKHEPRPVRAASVDVAPPPQELRFSGTIVPREQVAVSFKVAGRVAEVAQRRGADGRMRSLQQGDVVVRGAFLARLTGSEQRDRRRQSEAQIGSAQASLTRAEQDFARADTLYKSQSITRTELDAAQAALDVAKAQFQSMRAQDGVLATAVEDVTLTAPRAGVVLMRSVEVGQLASPDKPAFVIADLSAVKALCGVPEGVASRLALGQTLQVATDDSAQTSLRGPITAIAPAADPESRVFPVEVSLSNNDGALRAGMIVTVRIPADTKSAAPVDALAAPLESIVMSRVNAGGYAVIVVEGGGEFGTARLRDVTLGDVVGTRVVVKAGLESGERVVISGPSLISDGEPIRIVP
jgi:multidrug efflux system membrane fusion protein